MSENSSAQKPQPESHVQVQVVTTSGKFPERGFDEVPINQKVRIQLETAAKKLHIADTNGWVAMVGDHEVNVDQSYRDNGLTGEVVIDYGPREGGGGYE
jgi:hypothetical protein